jgi:O-methyltransferase domain/Dimerisation domain
MMSSRDLLSVTGGFQAATVVLAANHLGITASLARTPQAATSVAGALGLDPRAATAICEALAALGVLERDAGAFRVAAGLLDALTPGSPNSIVEALRHQWFLLQRWPHLDRVARSGEPEPRRSDDPEQQRAFILAMADLARMGARALWNAVDLGASTHLVDVGGGPGELAISALETYPTLRATIFDRGPVLAIAREYSASRGVSERLDFVTGDALHDPVPACDVALVSSLVHAYGVDETRRIAANVAAGVAPGGLVLIREFLWDDEAHSGPLPVALFAVNMLIGTPTGRCWTAAELESIFGAAGFGQWRSMRLDPRSSLLCGVRR